MEAVDDEECLREVCRQVADPVWSIIQPTGGFFLGGLKSSRAEDFISLKKRSHHVLTGD